MYIVGGHRFNSDSDSDSDSGSMAQMEVRAIQLCTVTGELAPMQKRATGNLLL